MVTSSQTLTAPQVQYNSAIHYGSTFTGSTNGTYASAGGGGYVEDEY